MSAPGGEKYDCGVSVQLSSLVEDKSPPNADAPVQSVPNVCPVRWCHAPKWRRLPAAERGGKGYRPMESMNRPVERRFASLFCTQARGRLLASVVFPSASPDGRLTCLGKPGVSVCRRQPSPSAPRDCATATAARCACLLGLKTNENERSGMYYP